MATNNSDFVLDDDLDEDEDILQLQSEQRAIEDELPSSPQGSLRDAATSEQPPLPLPVVNADNDNDAEGENDENGADGTRAVIVDGLPLSAQRADLDALLAACASSIASVQLRRLERHGFIRVRVEFESEEAVTIACASDGAELKGVYVSVKRASAERWDAATEESSPRPPSAPASSNLPQTSAMSKSFWSAFGAARTLAGRLEERARELGEHLEHQLHVSENVEKGRSRVRDSVRGVNAEYKVSERVAEIAQVGRETASTVDKKMGISEGVANVVDGVGGAARVVAREVDENLRVSEKVREATNAAMTNPTVGAVARSVVSSLDTTTPPRKKNYRPSPVKCDHEVGDSVGDVPTVSIDDDVNNKPST